MTRRTDHGNKMQPLTQAQQEEAAFRPSHVPASSWEQVLHLLPQYTLTGVNATPHISGLSLDSRTVLPGDLYLAISGAKNHGAEFADAARTAGAVAVLTDSAGAELLTDQNCPLPIIVVPEPRDVVGILAHGIFGHTHSKRLPLFGVTGTNGKTTTSYFIDSILTKLGLTTALVGTIETRLAGQAIPSSLTTPEAPRLHALFSKMVEEQGHAGIMEVSSHALSYRRVTGLHFDVAGFTNLTQDHLDLHVDMDSYFETKAQLFEPHRARTAVILTDGGAESYGTLMAQRVGERAVRLCTDGTDNQADWKVTNIRAEGLGHRFSLESRTGETIHTATALPGDFNIANAALAAVMVLSADLDSLGIDRPAVVDALTNTHVFDQTVPGRMEVVTHNPAGVVDFAHNPDAMIRTMTALKDAGAQKLILVFGATGERDVTKRGIMGAIAAQYADVVIVSDDDPHGEDPAQIRAQVMAGAQEWITTNNAKRTLVEISPRADAITYAANVAGAEDTILLAGRGHETSMDMDGQTVPIDDRDELRHAVQIAKERTAAR